MASFFDKQKIDEAGVVAVTLQKWLLFFAACNVVLAIFGLPWSLLSLCLKLSILLLGFHGSFRRSGCSLIAFICIKVVMIALEITGLIISVIFLTIGMGIVTYEAIEGTITIDPAALEISFVLLFVVGFLVVIGFGLYFAFNAYVMYLAAKCYSLLKKSSVEPQSIPMQPVQVKQLNNDEYMSVPQSAIPAEFIQQPVYLEKVVV